MVEEVLNHPYTVLGVWAVALLWLVILGCGLYLLRRPGAWWKRLGLFLLVLLLASLAARGLLQLKWAGGRPWGVVRVAGVIQGGVPLGQG